MKTISNSELKEILIAFESRANELGYKGKKLREMNLEFLCGAVAAYDVLFKKENQNKSSISPLIYFSALRGEVLTSDKIDVKI